MTTNERKVMEMALISLEYHSPGDEATEQIIDDVRKCLEQAEKQEPPKECQTEAEKRAYAFGWWKAMEANRTAQTRPATREEKIVNPGVYEVPVANHYVDGGHLVYPKEQREWRGLTNNELQPIADEYRILFGGWVEDFARAIEAKLKEKNHG